MRTDTHKPSHDKAQCRRDLILRQLLVLVREIEEYDKHPSSPHYSGAIQQKQQNYQYGDQQPALHDQQTLKHEQQALQHDQQALQHDQQYMQHKQEDMKQDDPSCRCVGDDLLKDEYYQPMTLDGQPARPVLTGKGGQGRIKWCPPCYEIVPTMDYTFICYRLPHKKHQKDAWPIEGHLVDHATQHQGPEVHASNRPETMQKIYEKEHHREQELQANNLYNLQQERIRDHHAEGKGHSRENLSASQGTYKCYYDPLKESTRRVECKQENNMPGALNERQVQTYSGKADAHQYHRWEGGDGLHHGPGDKLHEHPPGYRYDEPKYHTDHHLGPKCEEPKHQLGYRYDEPKHQLHHQPQPGYRPDEPKHHHQTQPGYRPDEPKHHQPQPGYRPDEPKYHQQQSGYRPDEPKRHYENQTGYGHEIVDYSGCRCKEPKPCQENQPVYRPETRHHGDYSGYRCEEPKQLPHPESYTKAAVMHHPESYPKAAVMHHPESYPKAAVMHHPESYPKAAVMLKPKEDHQSRFDESKYYPVLIPKDVVWPKHKEDHIQNKPSRLDGLKYAPVMIPKGSMGPTEQGQSWGKVHHGRPQQCYNDNKRHSGNARPNDVPKELPNYQRRNGLAPEMKEEQKNGSQGQSIFCYEDRLRKDYQDAMNTDVYGGQKCAHVHPPPSYFTHPCPEDRKHNHWSPPETTICRYPNTCMASCFEHPVLNNWVYRQPNNRFYLQRRDYTPF